MPVTFPGVFGYGSATRGAFTPGAPQAPILYEVTTRADTGLIGSLRYGVETLTQPRVIVSRVGGYFLLNSVLNIFNGYITLAGFSAPGAGIEIQQYGFFITAPHVHMAHMAIRPGQWGQGQLDNCSMIAFDTGAHDLFFDHVTSSWGYDESFAIDKYGGSDANVTFWRCNSLEGLTVVGGFSKGFLCQAPSAKVSFSQCITANNTDRNPYAQSGCKIAVTNCLMYNGKSVVAGPSFAFYDINGNNGTQPIFASIKGNHCIAGPQTGTDPTFANKGAFILLGAGGGLTPAAASRIYAADNLLTDYSGPGTPAVMQQVYNDWGLDPFVGSAPAEAPLSGFTIWASSRVERWLKLRAGTRPNNRPAADQRVLNYITARTSPGYLATQDTVGGYPPITPSGPITFTPPANFTATDPITGYTYGELWLQDMQWNVQKQTITVNAGDDLQEVLDMAETGDTIVLQAGATFTGNYTLPAHAGQGYITIMSAGTLPAAGTRVTPTTAANFAKLKASPGGLPALRTSGAANYWQIIGVEFLPNPGGFGDIIGLGDGSATQNDINLVPQNLILDRCYIHGDAVTGQKRGVSLQSGDTTIKNCWISSCFQTGQDTQAIAGWNGPGPWLIDNNYLEAAGENFLVGGNDIYINNQLPTGITFTNNTVAKLPGWRGQGYNAKNLFELKVGVNVLVQNNTFDYNWAGEGQGGWALVVTVRNEGGATPWATIRNVQILNNQVRHVASVLNVLGLDDRGPSYPSVLLQTLVVRDLLAYDVNTSWGGNGWFAQIQKGNGITLDHITHISNASRIVYFVTTPAVTASTFTLTNSIAQNGDNLVIFGDGGFGAGIPTLNGQAPGYTVARNVFYGLTPANYPPDASYPATIGAVGFSDIANNDYRLVAGSPYVNAALDGTDIGARLGANPPQQPPGLVSSPSPANGATNVVRTTGLSWGSASLATSYQVKFGTTTSPPLVNTQIGTTYQPPTQLAAGTTYFWQIIAVNSGGSTPGPLWSFTTASPALPSVPAGPSPANNATNVPIGTDLGWNDSSNTTSYTVKFGTANPPPQVATGVPTSDYTLPDLSYNQRYFWQIIAVGPGGVQAGPVWSFQSEEAPPPLDPPGVPNSPAPVNGATLVPLAQVLAWANGSNTDTVSVAFGTSATPPVVAAGVTAQSFNPGTLALSTLYFWQIVATGPGGTTPGPIWSFRTVDPVPVPPGQATAPSPANGAINQSRTPALTWTPGSGTLTHTVRFGTTSSPPVVAAGLPTATYTPGTLAYSTQYFWSVDEVNDDGVTAGAVWSFTTLAAPAPPGLVSSPSPADLATGVLVTANVSFAAASGALTYDIRFGTTNPPPLVSSAQVGTSYNPPGNLDYSTVYFWQAIATNGGGSTPGPVWRFTTEPVPVTPVPPAPPTTPSPANAATGVGLNPTLTWAGAAGATTYTVKFGTSSPPPTVAGGVLVQSYTPAGPLNYGTVYYWQIIANNADGSTAGPIWSFTTIPAPAPPSAPSNPAPFNGATNVPVTTGTSWNAASGATSYNVAFGTASSPPTVSTGQTGTSYTPLAPLADGTTYYWQVTAVNAGGSTIGPLWAFTTAVAIVPAPPAVVTNPSPANGATDVGFAILLTWTGGERAATFTIRFGTSPIPPIVASGVPVPVFNPGSLTPGTTYYWAVDGVNADGTTTGTVWSFTTGALPPTQSGYSYLYTSDGAAILTSDGSLIAVQDGSGGGLGGCLVPLSPGSRVGDPPPPNPIDVREFPPSGLVGLPLTFLEQLPDRIPRRPENAPTIYEPVDRFDIVATVLAGMSFTANTTIGCRAFSVVQAVVAASRAAELDEAGYLLFEYTDVVWDGHTCVGEDGRRFWANVVAYPDGSFYWILGGLGGYGLEPYWVFGGMADPALYVAP